MGDYWSNSWNNCRQSDSKKQRQQYKDLHFVSQIFDKNIKQFLLRSINNLQFISPDYILRVLNYLNMSHKLLILIIFINTVTSVQISATKIATIRNNVRTSLCNYYNGNFTDTERQNVKPIINSYSYLTDDQIEKILFKQDLSQPSIQTFLIVAPHAASLVILLIMIPGLACCCARPDKYPVCKKCRKSDNQLYTKIELKWPAFATIFCYIVISVGAAAALFTGPDITNHVNDVGCRITAVADDTLYGRISPANDSIFFVGINPLKSQLTDFSTKINTFFSQSNTSLNNSQAVRTHQTAIQSQINTQYTSYTNIVYSNAFRLSNGITYTNINSEFKDLFYGPVTDSTKILGNIYSQLEDLFSEVNTALDPMITAWLYLQGQTQASVTTYLSNTISNISSFETQLNTTLLYYQFFDKQDYYTSINLGIKAVYGVVLALGLLGLISSIVLTCCTVVRIRLIIYFTCVFLIFMAFITFSMLIVFAAFLPNVSQSCAYIDRKLSSETGLVQLMNNLQFNASASLYLKCSSTIGSGDIINKINSQFSQSFDSMVLISQYALTFNDRIPNFQSANFLLPFTQATTTINSVKTATQLQINDTISMNFLKALAYKTYTIDPVTCTNQANVNGDSWVPSRSVISCLGGSYAQNPCVDLSSTFTCPLGCYQLYDQLTNVAGDPSTYSSHLNSRYGTNCNYALYVIDLHEKWTQPKISNLATVQSNLNNIKTNVVSYEARVQTIQGSLSSFKSNLVQNFNSQTNLVTGSFNGVDCRVIGQSIAQLRDSMCVGVLTSIQYNVIMLCLISYGILLLSCFAVCAGVRHYQHLQKMQVKVGYKGVPVQVTSNRIIDKFDA